MLPVVFCPEPLLGIAFRPYLTQEPPLNGSVPAERVKIANVRFREAKIQREKEMTSLYYDVDNHQSNPLLQKAIVRSILKERLPASTRSATQSSMPATLVPLNDCIMDIIWELHRLPAPHSLLDIPSEKWMLLMRHAALYQVKIETVSIDANCNVQ